MELRGSRCLTGASVSRKGEAKTEYHVLECAEMAPKDHVLESSEMASKGHVLESVDLLDPVSVA